MEVLRTSRLLLRDFVLGDVDAVHAYASDPEVTQFTSFGPNTRDQTLAFIEFAAAAAHAQPRTDYTLAIQLQESGLLIGGCGLHNPNHNQWELGYVLARPYWSRGLATELVQGLAAFGFSKLGAQKIWAPVDAANAASSRVLQKSGFTLEGLLRQDRLRWSEGRDTQVYGLLSSEWNHLPCHHDQRIAANQTTSLANAEHYTWGDGCDGWHLLKHPHLSVIQERVPPGRGEIRHFHSRARQFFFVLKGKATLEFDDSSVTFGAGEGVHVMPGVKHRFANAGSEAVEFLVISSPATQGDRTNVQTREDAV